MNYPRELVTKLDDLYKQWVYLMDEADRSAEEDAKTISRKSRRLLMNFEEILYDLHSNSPDWMPSNLF